MADSEHDHWAGDSTFWHPAPPAAPGYDANNGLRKHSYVPAGMSAQQPAITPQPIYYPHMAAGTPEVQYHSHPSYMAYTPGYYVAVAPPAQVPMSLYSSYAMLPAQQPQANAWAGRTKAQVEEDNLKVASREGAYDPRKVEPIGVKDTQYFWVIEPDGHSRTLRTFMDIKELKGEWKTDPGWEKGYFFMCEPESKSEKKK